jgi:uroporphyrinogen decarboxylase
MSNLLLETLARRTPPGSLPPVWMMRQAGRYLPEYRALREKYSFLEMVKNPEASIEATLQPVRRYGVDGAIIFSDIMVPLIGVGLEMIFDPGPKLAAPLRSGADLKRLGPLNPRRDVPYLLDALAGVSARLDGEKTALLGFAGAPLTLAAYLIEGGGSKDFERTRALLKGDGPFAAQLLDRLAQITIDYLLAQIEAGAQAVQLFDSWVGCLAPDDYRRFVLPHTQNVIRSLTPGVPVIHFGTGTSGLLEAMREAGGDVIGLYWRIDLGVGWERVGYDVAVQGNLDPVALFAPRDEIRDRAARILERARGHHGHIFNLGHGILPQTPVDHVVALVDIVHELSSR